jgi:hypothetical protein
MALNDTGETQSQRDPQAPIGPGFGISGKNMVYRAEDQGQEYDALGLAKGTPAVHLKQSVDGQRIGRAAQQPHLFVLKYAPEAVIGDQAGG